MTAFPFKPDAPNVEVIGIGVAQKLEPPQLLEEALKVCNELQSVHKAQKPILRHFVHLGHHDLVGTVIERAGVFTIFIGLGLEVISATQGIHK
jgi:hypothetical protein